MSDMFLYNRMRTETAIYQLAAEFAMSREYLKFNPMWCFSVENDFECYHPDDKLPQIYLDAKARYHESIGKPSTPVA